MEPPKEFWASLWSFICFLPYFIGLWLLGNIKGIILCPLICLIMTIGNSTIIISLWSMHTIWTYYCVIRCRQLGPLLKLVMCTILLPVMLILWPIVGIIGSIIGGAAYGFISPLFATFEAIEGGKNNKVFHCFIDGTWSTILKSFDIVKDVINACFHTYFSFMDDLRQEGPPNGKYYEMRPYYLPGAIVAAILGIIVDVPIISFVAGCKVPFMLFKGWNRLFHDLIGREGPFLETICVPFAGLAILLWPLAVVGAFLASVIASIFLGVRAGVVTYQESSLLFGLRPNYRRVEISQTNSDTNSISKTKSLTKTISRTISLTNNIAELKPFELLDGLCKECLQLGETLVSQGLITHDDIQEAMFGKESRVISIGLPAYCLLQALLRSIKADSPGILITDDTELTTTNRPKEKFFEWFLNPLLIMKDQIKAQNLSLSEEDYLCKLVLFNGDPNRVKSLTIGPPPESDRKLAELDALARRLQGITKFITRFPTYKRRFDVLVKTLSEELADKYGNSTIIRSKSAFPRIFSLKSFKVNKTVGSDQESELG
ncbi:uncharacterized membrane protein At3g27390-like isoform X2 [Cicer arietinum]|uniref:Uncharacterized membrane protein At3g27390-like isoform X2 n=1 Tax=Cicer arietinum TaxID=3827 RepID=A0A1S2XHR9_CICAR|nr:uncharacterized membrane protein At3g27390-like isoform X2 [Cicer arietinum]